MRRAWLVTCLLLACSPRRQLGVEFSGARQEDTDAIAQVVLEIYDGDDCTCLELDSKPGCGAGEQLARLDFTPGHSEQTAGGLPAGRLVVRASAFDSAQLRLPLRIECWCVPDLPEQSVVFPLGTPTDANGRGCSSM